MMPAKGVFVIEINAPPEPRKPFEKPAENVSGRLFQGE